ncbi:VWA domain-containing protein [Rhodohalobacter sp. SW132]|uniref:VWA domain-containing protein n=1 Tax=Rhodohalobacter sp. SW132 TaxID=2293433 RepID=UPI000E2561D3|nr:vWA domain-containing protein [Rhodohalobacter sp. SW132]REL37882.1 VWA domain-containing protein [Rhodohalobacter sp. SW132]
MKEGLSEIICIIDASGSMKLIKNDAIGGFISFLDEQKKLPGDATLTLIQFNTDYDVIHENKPLSEVNPIRDKDYIPTGSTALLDAVGKAIDSTGRRLASTSEEHRPEKVIVAILTDGEENASTSYDLPTIKDMIRHQKEKYSWEFIFLGANQDSFAEAAKIGIESKDTINFAATDDGIRTAYSEMSNSITTYRKK